MGIARLGINGTQHPLHECRAEASSATVIIPAYNQEQHLGACLDAVLRDCPAAVSVLVVDDRSTDGTVEIAGSRGVEVVHTAVNGGPAVARNLGAKHASGEILIFVDADVVVAPDALRRIMDAFADDVALAAVFGSYDARPHARSLVSEYRNLLHHFTHQQAAAEANTFWTGCGAVRAGAFQAAGGFDERRELNYIEDVELGWRLRRRGCRIRLDKSLLATHRKRWTLTDMVRTDVLFRARPWSKLILEGRAMFDGLNLRWTQRLAVPLAVTGAAFLGLGIVDMRALLASAAALLIALVLSAPFFRFIVDARGVVFAMLCAPLHIVHYLCSAAGFLMAMHQSGQRWRMARFIRTATRATSNPGL